MLEVMIIHSMNSLCKGYFTEVLHLGQTVLQFGITHYYKLLLKE